VSQSGREGEERGREGRRERGREGKRGGGREAGREISYPREELLAVAIVNLPRYLRSELCGRARGWR